MNIRHLHFSGILVSSPYPQRPLLASSMVFPLVDEADYAAYTAFKGNSDTKINISFTEHYQLLAEIIEHIDTLSLQLDCIYLRLAMPCIGRIPKILMRDSILISVDPFQEALRQVDRGRQVLIIADRFVKHRRECGDNRISIDLYSHQDQTEGFERLQAFLAGYNILPEEVAGSLGTAGHG